MDGKVDLSDVIGVLNYLFLGGSIPALLEPTPGLPVTGVKACYLDGLRVDCPEAGQPFHGQDGTYQAGLPRDFETFRPAFEDPSAWYTIDFATGLMWQYQPAPGRKTWTEALTFARSLGLGDYHDWRLPNITELLSIQSFEPGGLGLDPDAFQPIDDPLYTVVWSSTTFSGVGNASDALVVDSVRGTIHASAKEPGYGPAYLRAVRSISPLEHGDLNGDGAIDLADALRLLFHLFADGSSATLRGPVKGLPATGQVDCYDATQQIPCALLDGEGDPSPFAGQDGHVQAGVPRSFELVKPDPNVPATWYTVDRSTGLAWQYSEALESKSLAEALAYCEDLELGGFDDWRLPNVRELQSIADYGRQPRLNPAYFELGSLGHDGRDHWEFWTSTPGITFLMDLGFVSTASSEPNWVRAVRTVEAAPPGG
jgi:hypothetical protein